MIERQEEEESGTLGMEAFCHSPDRCLDDPFWIAIVRIDKGAVCLTQCALMLVISAFSCGATQHCPLDPGFQWQIRDQGAQFQSAFR